MTTDTDRVRAELNALKHQTFEIDSPQGRVVCFDYEIETGTHKGEKVLVGVSFHSGENGYPEYPPHWVHVCPPISDSKSGATANYTDAEGRPWLAMSRTPGPIWDNLPTKHMSAYINEHLRRIWKDV